MLLALLPAASILSFLAAYNSNKVLTFVKSQYSMGCHPTFDYLDNWGDPMLALKIGWLAEQILLSAGNLCYGRAFWCKRRRKVCQLYRSFWPNFDVRFGRVFRCVRLEEVCQRSRWAAFVLKSRNRNAEASGFGSCWLVLFDVPWAALYVFRHPKSNDLLFLWNRSLLRSIYLPSTNVSLWLRLIYPSFGTEALWEASICLQRTYHSCWDFCSKSAFRLFPTHICSVSLSERSVAIAQSSSVCQNTVTGSLPFCWTQNLELLAFWHSAPTPGMTIIPVVKERNKVILLFGKKGRVAFYRPLHLTLHRNYSSQMGILPSLLAAYMPSFACHQPVV